MSFSDVWIKKWSDLADKQFQQKLIEHTINGFKPF